MRGRPEGLSPEKKAYVVDFLRQLPARGAMGANRQALGARVEIECLVVLK